MHAERGIASRRERRPERQIVRWCPECRGLCARLETCSRCGASGPQLLPLVRGLASLEVAGEHGLVRYRGERLTVVAGALLVLLIPVTGAVAFVTRMPLVPVLLGVCFVGLPALAFADARRAGAQAAARRAEAPDLVPGLPPPPRDEQPAGMRFCGVAARLDAAVSAPVSQQAALAYRIDIRAGRDAELVAHHTEGVDFLVTAGEGTQVLITGVVEVHAAEYRGIEPTSEVRLTVNGGDLLPALFAQGGFACEIFIRDGDIVEVSGPLSGETRAHPLGAGYRAPGAISVLRGTAGNPAVIRWSGPAARQPAAPE